MVPMKVAVSGSSGLVGSMLVPSLREQGHTVVRLVREAQVAGEEDRVLWDPASGAFRAERLEGFDAVVHLAGEPIDQRWSQAARERILTSRVDGTKMLVDGLKRLQDPPEVLVSASAVGYYGDRGEAQLEEAAEPGDNWVAGVCEAWEQATEPAARAGMRTVQLRFGIILSPEGGALAKMLPPFRLGLGGPIAGGDQWYSWISRRDAGRAVERALEDEQLEGPVNTSTPNPATNAAFTEALGAALNRPTVFPIPGFAMRMLYGPMADELLMASARMVPAKLEKVGFAWQDPEIGPAFERMLA